MGMQCQCPQCGMAFIIPTIAHPARTAGVESAAAAHSPQIELEPLGPIDVLAESADRAAPSRREEVPDLDLSEIAATELSTAINTEPMLHIPCPNGHELETPLDMVGQRARCPHCGAEFRLRREKSIEYLQAQEIIDRRRAKFWFQLAIMAATFVGFVLVVMIGIMLFS